MLTAGVSQVDITPPLGIGMRGYFEARTATTVHDPLHVRSFALESDTGAVALAVCDIIGLRREYIDQAKERIAETTGLRPDQVMVSCTHTHTGPHTGDDDYTQFVIGRVADGVRIAWDRREPALVGWGSGSESRVVFNRRYRMKGGTVQTNPGLGNPDVVEPVGPVDPEVGVMELRRSDGSTLGLLANYALHYVGIPDDHHAISADYFGFFSETMPRLVGGSFVAALANGASGDINNLDVLGNARPANDHYQHIERVAGVVAAAALWGRNEAEFTDEVTVGSALAELTLPPRPAPTDEDVARAEEIEARVEEGRPVLMGERSFARRVRRMAEDPPEPRDTVVQALRIGDLGVTSAPGEFFVELGLAIKQRSPFAQTMVLELGNDSVGYIPTARAFEEGAYEPESSSYEPGFGEQIVDTAVGLLEGLHGG